MAQPQAYDRTVDFTQRDGDDTDHAGINAELDAAAISINQIRDNLALIQKDDGGLANGIVTPDSLAPEVFEALTLDISAQVADASASAQSALNSAISAAASAAAAAASQIAATTSENASALNASGAATSAGAAQASQTAAAASSAAALVSENNADASEAAALVSANAGAASAAAALADKNAAAASAAAALVSANGASASATTATTQATTATTQATTATTQAAIATTKAADAAASAASINLPVSLVGKLLNFLRVKADESGYELRTAVQVKADIITAGSVVQADLATAVLPLGVGQTWQNVAASRASGVTYTNSTGRPISVSASFSVSGGSGNIQAICAGVNVFDLAVAIGTRHTVTFVIPNGATYSITVSTGTVSSWAELR